MEDAMETDKQQNKESALPATLSEESARLREENMNLRKENADIKERFRALGATYEAQMKKANETIQKLQAHIKGLTGSKEPGQ
jgi:flagellar motility protein MotE (MotC chaperone)